MEGKTDNETKDSPLEEVMPVCSEGKGGGAGAVEEVGRRQFMVVQYARSRSQYCIYGRKRASDPASSETTCK